MEHFLQAVALALVAVVLGLVLEKQGKDLGMLLTIAACVLILGAAFTYLRPILAFLEQLQDLGDFSSDLVTVLFKIVGMGLLTEVAAMVCADAGKASLGKALELAGSMGILWLSIPIFTVLIDLVKEILGAL